MAVIRCRFCDRLIDLDWDVEHEGDCAWEHGVDLETGDDLEEPSG